MCTLLRLKTLSNKKKIAKILRFVSFLKNFTSTISSTLVFPNDFVSIKVRNFNQTWRNLPNIILVKIHTVKLEIFHSLI